MSTGHRRRRPARQLPRHDRTGPGPTRRDRGRPSRSSPDGHRAVIARTSSSSPAAGVPPAAVSCPRRSRRRASHAAARARILAGPCVWSRSASSRVPTSTGWRRWSRSRSPSGGRGPGRDPAPTPTGSSTSAARSPPATGRTRSPTWSPGPGGCAPTTASTSGPVAVHVPSDAGRWVVTWPWAGAERARLIAEAAFDLASRSVSPARRTRLTGTQARIVDRWQERIAGRPRDAAVLDPRRGPADAGDLDHGHQRQVDGDPADHPHPAARPAGTSARRPPTGSWSTSGWSIPATGPVPAAPRSSCAGTTSTWPSWRPPGAAWSCAAWATSRTTPACSPTCPRTTSTSRGSTPSPSWPR